MKSKYQLLTELIPLIEAFEATNQKVEMSSFLQFATQKQAVSKVKTAIPLDRAMQLQSNQVGFFLNYLFRFFKGYTRVA